MTMVGGSRWVNCRASPPSAVMAGLDPATHVFLATHDPTRAQPARARTAALRLASQRHANPPRPTLSRRWKIPANATSTRVAPAISPSAVTVRHRSTGPARPPTMSGISRANRPTRYKTAPNAPPRNENDHQRRWWSGSLETAQRRPRCPLGFRLGHTAAPPRP